jgi:hypothetical protein
MIAGNANVKGFELQPEPASTVARRKLAVELSGHILAIRREIPTGGGGVEVGEVVGHTSGSETWWPERRYHNERISHLAEAIDRHDSSARLRPAA